jgi:hypothetical protein
MGNEEECYRRQCQFPGCEKPVEGTGRFCGGACRTADWKMRKQAGKPKRCSACHQLIKFKKPRKKKVAGKNE